MENFVHLHVHSEYSLLDGACRIRELVSRAAEAGHKALAITDHGVMYGAVEFFRTCKEYGIKPIIGCEVYVARRSRFDKEGKKDASGYHMILLCKNETGYKNLIYLVSASYTEGFYVKPRIDVELLRAHSEGLVALSACIGGAIPQLIMSGLYDEAEKYALNMRDIFGEDSLYLELQNHGLDAENKVYQALLELSKKTGIPIVATNDIHYVNRSDADTHALLLCIQTNSSIEDEKPFGFNGKEYYYKSTSEMRELFRDFPDACNNTSKIADMCNFEFEFGKTHLPAFRTETGESCGDYLRRLAYDGFEEKKKNSLVTFVNHSEDEYLRRIEYELSVIDKMGFNDYFLIVRDFVNFAKTKGIPVGPGRGSGAGSLVAFCIGITGIDSIKYDLLFERFLNPERISLPDFDIDFCYNRRDEVIEYVKRKYGEDHVAQIVTFGTMAARAAVRDVGRAMGMPYSEVDKIAKLIPRDIHATLDGALKTKELKELYDSDIQVKRLMDAAMKLEGMPRNASTHAAGVVITEKPTKEYVPVSLNGDSIVTQYDMNTDADLGLVKFDFLALRNLTIIDDAVRMINLREPDFDIEKIDLDDKESYELISNGYTSGIFQLEKPGMTKMLTKLKPEKLEDIIAALALYRPGPMDNIPTYIARRHGEEKVVYDTPLLAKVLDVTYGCIVYQEQVMEIFRLLAGYSFARADLVRRAMAKKKTDVMMKERNGFLSGAAIMGISSDVANKIFDDMVNFAKYAFNKSHATAYATISYRTAYLKAHYPCEYMSALLTSVLGDTVKIQEYISECNRLKISVLPPDINESFVDFKVSGKNKIRFGLFALKNVGRQFLECVIEKRKDRPFKSFGDFITRMSGCDLNKRQIEALIKSGCFDSLGEYRSRLLSSYEIMIDGLSVRNRMNISGQLDIFSCSDEKISDDDFHYPDIPEFPHEELMRLEKESSGMYFSGHLLDDYTNFIKSLRYEKIFDIIISEEEDEETGKFSDRQAISVIGIITAKSVKQTHKGANMVFLTVEDRYADIEVVVFPKQCEKFSEHLFVGNAVHIVGNLSFREEEKPKILLSSIEPLVKNENMEAEEGKTVYVRVEKTDSPLCSAVLDFAYKNSGKNKLIFFSSSDKKYFSVKGCSITLNDENLTALRQLTGYNNVIIK